MAINVTSINEIADTIIAFVPTLLIISVVGWIMGSFNSSLR